MTVSFTNNILMVKTGITEESLKKAYGKKLSVKDDKGNEVYALSRTNNAYGADIAPFGITTNAVVDGELAVVMVQNADVTLEQIKTVYGDALVAAQKYLPVIATEIDNRAAAIDSIFA